MDLQLKDKVVIVTGGAKGIGAAIVHACAAEGAIPVIVGRDAEAGTQLQSELQNSGATCGLITVDLATAENSSQSVEQTLQTFVRIDALVSNAGRNDKVGLESGSVDEYVASLNRNLVHYYGMAHYALPHLKRSRGVIVNIGSKTAVTGQGSTSGYASSKGGIMALTREWAAELLPYGIRVNTVIPAEVMTPLYRKLGSSLLVMSIIGGAVCPAIMGRISDGWNIQRAFVVPLVCHAYVFYFAMWGYRSAAVANASTGLAIPATEVE
jgi:L-fucose dehydrogenase